MKTRLHWLIFGILIVGSGTLWAQEVTPETIKGAKEVTTLNYKYVPSIAEQIRKGTFIPAEQRHFKEPININPKMKSGAKVVPGKGSKGPDALAEVQRSATQIATRAPSIIFEAASGLPFAVSDPTGAIGRDFYVAAWNTGWRIFNRDGTPATPAASLASLLGDNDGDPIVLYDSEADRYIIMEFETAPPFGFKIAISTTNDPVNDGWHTYDVSDFGTSAFPDYQKMSIWSDAYYMTANIGTREVWALDRDKMLTGDPTATMQTFSIPGGNGNPPLGFYSPHFFSVTDDNHPADGGATFVLQQDDAWAGVSGADRLHLWEVNVDFTTPENSDISGPNPIPVTPFVGVFDGGAFNNLTQPNGVDCDALQSLISNQAQFRRFGTHNSAVFSHVVDVGTGGTELAAVRWYELRQTADNQPWTLHQEGTYVAPEGRHAWNASLAMDASGNIAMGYTSMGGINNEVISSRYTGQFVGAPAGVMNAVEETIRVGTGSSNNERYSDYSHLTVDPVDNATFWFINEIYDPDITDIVGVFQLTAPAANDVGVSAITAPDSGVLGATEPITVDIRNFGTNDQSNIPVRYTIDGGAAIEETFTGTIAAGATESYTFTQTADFSTTNQTYTILAYTELAGDAEPGNDSTTKDVTNAANYCVPEALSGCGVDGIKRFILGTIDTDDGGDGCNGNGSGYVDRRDLTTDLDRDPSANPHVLQAQHNWTGNPDGEGLSVWIDFDDSGTFEESERLISGEMFSVAAQLESFDLPIPDNAPLGLHVLRAKAIDITDTGDILDPCSDFSFGEVHDYTVNIIDSSLSLDDPDLDGASFTILSKPDKQFEVILETPYSGKLTFNLFNLLGQQLVFNVIEKGNDGRYVYELDMSYASTGVYIVKVGLGETFKTGRIVVN